MNQVWRTQLVRWFLVIVIFSLLSAGYAWTRYVDYNYPDMRMGAVPWQRALCRQLARYIYSNMRSDWLEDCSSPHRVLIKWRPSSGWVANAIVDLQERSVFAGAGNGISYTVPYANANAKTERVSLTDEQISNVLTLLSKLPLGESYAISRLNYEDEFHIAFFQDGILQIRHYPRDNLPEPVIQLAEVLHLWLDPANQQ